MQKITTSDFSFEVTYKVLSQLNSTLLLSMQKTNLIFIGNFSEILYK
jgi:hypothetical protein